MVALLVLPNLGDARWRGVARRGLRLILELQAAVRTTTSSESVVTSLARILPLQQGEERRRRSPLGL